MQGGQTREKLELPYRLTRRIPENVQGLSKNLLEKLNVLNKQVCTVLCFIEDSHVGCSVFELGRCFDDIWTQQTRSRRRKRTRRSNKNSGKIHRDSLRDTWSKCGDIVMKCLV